MKYFCPIAILIVLVATPSLGQLYEYTDKNGNRVITDSPPPGIQTREKKFSEERVYRSSRTERDYPTFENKDIPGQASQRKEKQKKNYSRVSAVMYMTDW